MNSQDFAARLREREYMNEITKAEEAEAKAAGLVVIFGFSDDSVELRGAIRDEIGAYGGTTLRITPEGVLPMWGDVECTDESVAETYFRRKALPFAMVDAEWAPNDEPDLSWRFKTTLPHATFLVMNGGQTFCRGIVFALADVTVATQEKFP